MSGAAEPSSSLFPRESAAARLFASRGRHRPPSPPGGPPPPPGLGEPSDPAARRGRRPKPLSRKASHLPGSATPRTAEPQPTRAVWTLRGPRSAAPPAGGSGPPRSVTRGPRLGASVRVRRAAPRPPGKESRAPLRAPGLPLRSAPRRLRAPAARPRARYCGRPAPRAQRPGLRGSGGERRAAAPRPGPVSPRSPAARGWGDAAECGLRRGPGRAAGGARGPRRLRESAGRRPRRAAGVTGAAARPPARPEISRAPT